LVLNKAQSLTVETTFS